MAETAKVLCPGKRCSYLVLRRGARWPNRATPATLRPSRPGTRGIRWFSYVNTTVGVKGADRYLLHFVECPESRGVDPGRPPRHLRARPQPGRLHQEADRPREYGDLGRGVPCSRGVFARKLLRLKRSTPQPGSSCIPECRAYIIEVADFVGSTAAILDYCGRSGADEFIVVTESGILAEMKRRYPDKTFIPAPPDDETCGCNNCKVHEDGDAGKHLRMPRAGGPGDRARRRGAPQRPSVRS